VGEHPARRYAAFLSYSHKDAADARWLHRRLESYRLPRRLAGSDGEHGIVPARLTPIFRDREELSAAGDLSESVRAALAASANLIVICSPNSAGSPWVAKEIAVFRELHPGRPVFAAIVAGDPADCFPPNLPPADGAEPLAADLRAGRDGRRLGFLKLVAGLAGVPLDALVQRDAQRRVRRVTAVTAAAVAAMLVMAIMTTLALNARAEAQRQRAEAEGLVEFMLTDLRDKLREVGRLDVHDTVNERVIAYYAAQGPLTRLPDDSLERRARVLQAMGEDADKRDDKPGALARFREAHATTAETLARRPRDPAAIFAHAQSEYWLGYMAFGAKEWPGTAQHWGQYRSLAGRLVAADAAKPEWLRELAYADGNLCTLDLVRKAPATAVLETCQRAVAQMARVRSLLPGDKKAICDLANRYGWLGEAWDRSGDKEKALAALKMQERLLQPLVERDPADAKLQDQWMRTLLSLAEFLEGDGKIAEGDKYRRRTLSVAEILIRRDPANAKWRGWMRRILKSDSK
jgi:hypothetical protein